MSFDLNKSYDVKIINIAKNIKSFWIIKKKPKKNTIKIAGIYLYLLTKFSFNFIKFYKDII